MEHTITLNQQQLQIISAALCEIPYRVAAPVIDSIQKQLQSPPPASAQKEKSDSDEQLWPYPQ
jgi:hypothetical protein